jgi:hypothetical protein
MPTPKVNKVCGVHPAPGQSLAQSRSRKTGNSHGLRIKLRNSSAEPVCIIAESSPIEFYKDVQTLQLSLHCNRCPKQISNKKTHTEDLKEGELVNMSQMDIKRKTCDIRTFEKHLFLETSSANIDTLVPSLYQCIETLSIEVF